MESFDPHDEHFYWNWRDQTPGIPNGGHLGRWANNATLEELKAARKAALPYAAYVKLQGNVETNWFQEFMASIDNYLDVRFPDHE